MFIGLSCRFGLKSQPSVTSLTMGSHPRPHNPPIVLCCGDLYFRICRYPTHNPGPGSQLDWSAPPPPVHSSTLPQSAHHCSLWQCRQLQGDWLALLSGPQSCSLKLTPPGPASLSCPGVEPSLPVAVGDVRVEGQGQFSCSHTLRAASPVLQQQGYL